MPLSIRKIGPGQRSRHEGHLSRQRRRFPIRSGPAAALLWTRTIEKLGTAVAIQELPPPIVGHPQCSVRPYIMQRAIRPVSRARWLRILWGSGTRFANDWCRSGNIDTGRAATPHHQSGNRSCTARSMFRGHALLRRSFGTFGLRSSAVYRRRALMSVRKALTGSTTVMKHWCAPSGA
jgi:hypothetical protein